MQMQYKERLGLCACSAATGKNERPGEQKGTPFVPKYKMFSEFKWKTPKTSYI
jgi:hypothetical protein